MRVAVEEARAETVPASGALARFSFGGVFLALAGVLLCAAVFAGDGSSDERLFWIGAGAILLASAAIGGSLAGLIPRPSLTPAGTVCVVALALLAAFCAATIAWSIAPERSWAYANRGLVYLMFLVLGVYVGALVDRVPRRLAASLAVVAAALAGWALAGKIAPGLFPDGARIARLRAPVGYWNALALLFAIGLPLALWLVSDRARGRAIRAAAAVLIYALVVATALTYSRGGIVVAVVAVLAWLALSPARFESLLALVVAVPPAVAVAAWAFRQPGIVDNFQAFDVRVRDGWQFGLVFSLGGLVALGVSLLVLRREERLRGLRVGRRLAVGLAALLVAVVLGLAFQAGHPVAWLEAQLDEFTNPASAQVTQGPSRIGELGSNNRWSWWQNAWDVFRDDPLQGSGAATFELTNLQRRTSSLTVTEPHNVPLQFLSETGIGGFVLLAAFVVAAFVAVRQALARLTGRDRAAAGALAAGMAAFLLHSLADKDWDYVALAAPLFLSLGVLLAAGRPVRGGGHRAFALAAVLLAWGALYAVAAPYFSTRLVDRTYELLGAEAAAQEQRIANVEEAIRAAERARSLNPLAVEPLFALASALDVNGFETQAHNVLYDAVKLQPKNPAAWFELGMFEFEGQRNNAFNHLDNAYELDPYGPAGPALDELRAIFRAEKEKCQAAGTC